MSKPIEVQKASAKKPRARACEHPKADVPNKREIRATELSKVARTLLEILTDDDLQSVAEVYRGALHANQRHWVDEGKDPKTGRARGHWEVIPDFKTRIAAANMIAAYKEGLPVQRQVVISKKFESAEEIIDSIRESPALRRALLALKQSGVEVEAAGEIIDVETIVHLKGSENEEQNPE